jgi:hypothetical protein
MRRRKNNDLLMKVSGLLVGGMGVHACVGGEGWEGVEFRIGFLVIDTFVVFFIVLVVVVIVIAVHCRVVVIYSVVYIIIHI